MARPPSFDRDQALADACDLFWRKGYNATSVKDLEDALGLKAGSIYGAFGNKEALYAEALALYDAAQIARFKKAMAAAPSPLAGVAAYVRSIGEKFGGDTPRACMIVKTLLEAPETAKSLQTDARERLDHVRSLFAAAFEQAVELGELPTSTNTAHLASRLQSNIVGLLCVGEIHRDPARTRAIAEDIALSVETLNQAPA
ncbi:MAG: TetR/AcrR family transcriptional regulator [Neomegalonema sp.]|nr:TetR/AcrR family transcriptional regulator [Neomegalonema sp.]